MTTYANYAVGAPKDGNNLAHGCLKDWQKHTDTRQTSAHAKSTVNIMCTHQANDCLPVLCCCRVPEVSDLKSAACIGCSDPPEFAGQEALTADLHVT